MDIIAFLSNDGEDFKGRRLSDIWSMSDQEIEATHDFIQIVFPLDEPSQSSFHGVYLGPEDIEAAISNAAVREALIKSSEWFLGFLSRSLVWRSGYNHNQLRITRVIKCLRMLVGEQQADRFRGRVLDLLPNKRALSEECLRYWKEA